MAVDIAVLRDLLGKAAPGTWSSESVDGGSVILDGNGDALGFIRDPVDAALLLKAVETLPAMLDELERLRGYLAQGRIPTDWERGIEVMQRGAEQERRLRAAIADEARALVASGVTLTELPQRITAKASENLITSVLYSENLSPTDDELFGGLDFDLSDSERS